MRSESVTPGNVSQIEWDEEYFKYCDFEAFSIEGKTISSDFVGCSFKSLDWYWGLFSGCNFVNCEFVDCHFAGTAFPDTRFVDCKIVNCEFKQDNLGRDCDFTSTIAYGCAVESSSAFRPQVSTSVPIQ